MGQEPTETPHPAGGRLRVEVTEGAHQRINIHAPHEAPSDALASSDVLEDMDDPFLQGLDHLVSEAEEMAASHQRIEAMIDMIEFMSYSFGEPSQTFSGTFHARRLASSMRLHQLSSLMESNAATGLLGGDDDGTFVTHLLLFLLIAEAVALVGFHQTGQDLLVTHPSSIDPRKHRGRTAQLLNSILTLFCRQSWQKPARRSSRSVARDAAPSPTNHHLDVSDGPSCRSGTGGVLRIHPNFCGLSQKRRVTLL